MSRVGITNNTKILIKNNLKIIKDYNKTDTHVYDIQNFCTC